MQPTANAGKVELEALVETFRRLLPRGTRTLLPAYAVLTVGRLMFQTPGWVVSYVQVDAFRTGSFTTLGGFSGVGACATLFQIAGELAMAALTIGLLRTIAPLAHGAGDPTDNALSVLRRAARRYGHSLAVVVIMAAAGVAGALVCCVGALAAVFFLVLAPWLVTAREQEIAPSLEGSARTALRHVPVVALGAGALVIAGVVSVGIRAGLSALALSALGAVGVLVAAPIGFLVGAAVGYVALLWVGALAHTIEAAERGQSA